MGQHNIIELNGKQYDALTGALLGQSKITATPATQAAHLKRQGRAVDGFIRHNNPSNLKPAVIKPAPMPAKHVAAPVHAASNKVAAHAQKSMGGISKPTQKRGDRTLTAHQPEKPKTLMRHAVKKPKTVMKPAIKTVSPAEMMARPMSTLTKPLEKKLSVTQVNPVRMGRASRISKSHHIRRFSENRQQQTKAVHMPIPAITAATAAPAVIATNPAVPQAVTISATRPVTSRSPQQYSARPVRHDFRPATAIRNQQAAPITQTSTTQKNGAADIFEAALAHATSHEQKPLRPNRRSARRKRLVNVMAGLGAFLVIAGFIAYLNKPTIELRVASMRAGFHAQMPSYKPTGYALAGGVKSSDGKIAMQFRSGEDSYQITQEASDWNSSTLLDQAAENRGAPTRTIQSKGRTIYIYNDSAATWVNGGVRYEISGNSALDASELVSLATSM